MLAEKVHAVKYPVSAHGSGSFQATIVVLSDLLQNVKHLLDYWLLAANCCRILYMPLSFRKSSMCGSSRMVFVSAHLYFIEAQSVKGLNVN